MATISRRHHRDLLAGAAHLPAGKEIAIFIVRIPIGSADVGEG
jgi:hypothetical protein